MRITVVNRTKSDFRVFLLVEATYVSEKLYKHDFRVFDFLDAPIKVDYRVILEKAEEE